MKLAVKILLASALTFTCAVTGSEAQTLKNIRIGYPFLSFRQSNVWVAKEAGLFNKYGLEVEPIFLRGGQIATQALAGGDPPIVNIGTVVQANLTGFSLVLVAAVETAYDQIVFARPEIKSLEQLKGKRFGISGFGAATHYATIILMRHLKFEPKDLQLVPAGPDAERLAAMSAGKIDASLFTSSAAAPARRAGFAELLQVADLGVEVQGNGFATSRAYVQSNRDVVKNALKAFVEAIYFIYANKKEAQRFLQRLRKIDSEESLPDTQGDPVHARHARRENASGKDRQARAVRRLELLTGTRERKFFQRDGEAISDEVKE